MRRVLMLCVLAGLVGCAAPIVKKPQALTVKTLAIVSVYTNETIFDVEEKTGQTDVLKALKKVVSGEQGLKDENVQIATAALQTFSEELNGLGQWVVVPPAKVFEHPAYQAFARKTSEGGALRRLADTAWAAPPGVPVVQREYLTGVPGQIQIGRDDTKEPRETLGALCRELGVDAVAVVEVSLAYKTGWLSGMRGTGLFSGVHGRAKPSVASSLVAVMQDGRIALQTEDVTRQDRYVSENAPMLLKGRVDLKGDSGQESIVQFNAAVKASAAAMKQAIAKELAKG